VLYSYTHDFFLDFYFFISSPYNIELILHVSGEECMD